MRRLVATGIICLLAGCALVPDYYEVAAEHQSHLTQHEPFTDQPTEYGSEIIEGVAGWGKSSGGPFAELSEGYAVGPNAILGPREIFQGRAGYRWRVRPNLYTVG